MKITIVQTILQIEFPDGDTTSRVRPTPPPRKQDWIMLPEPIDEDAYYRVLEMWEAEGGRV